MFETLADKRTAHNSVKKYFRGFEEKKAIVEFDIGFLIEYKAVQKIFDKNPDTYPLQILWSIKDLISSADSNSDKLRVVSGKMMGRALGKYMGFLRFCVSDIIIKEADEIDFTDKEYNELLAANKEIVDRFKRTNFKIDTGFIEHHIEKLERRNKKFFNEKTKKFFDALVAEWL